MKGYIVILLLFATFLVQQCTARSVRTRRSVQSSDRDGFWTHVFEDYIDFVHVTLRQSKDYLQRSQAEIAEMSEPSQTMRQLNSSITALLTDINEALEKPKATGDEAAANFREIVLCFARTTTLPVDYALEKDAIELLLRNGFSKFLDDFDKDVRAFLDKFDADCRGYLANLSVAQTIEEHDMIKWYIEFKEGPEDLTKRLQRAIHLFYHYKPGVSFHL